MTTNNVQEDKPQPTAFERQVQTLTAVVERLTKQNQVLEEQQRRRQETVFKKKTKKVRMSSEEPKKDQKVVTPRADRSDKT